MAKIKHITIGLTTEEITELMNLIEKAEAFLEERGSEKVDICIKLIAKFQEKLIDSGYKPYQDKWYDWQI